MVSDSFVRNGWGIEIHAEAITIGNIELLRFMACGTKKGDIGLLNLEQANWAVLLQSSRLGQECATLILSSDSKHKLMRDIRNLIPVSAGEK